MDRSEAQAMKLRDIGELYLLRLEQAVKNFYKTPELQNANLPSDINRKQIEGLGTIVFNNHKHISFIHHSDLTEGQISDLIEKFTIQLPKVESKNALFAKLPVFHGDMKMYQVITDSGLRVTVNPNEMNYQVTLDAVVVVLV